MCRLAAFPPGFPYAKAVQVLIDFRGKNDDGVGSARIVDGKTKIEKWPRSLDWVLDNTDFLQFMPFDGWTIAHLRAASHGDKSYSNTHPFVVGGKNNQTAVVHNGIWTDYALVGEILSAAKATREPYGDTDTEVGALCAKLIGVDNFARIVTGGGVWLFLHTDGSLEVAKTSGELEVKKLENGACLLASTLGTNLVSAGDDVINSYIKFDKAGNYLCHKKYGYETRRFFADKKEENDWGVESNDFSKLIEERRQTYHEYLAGKGYSGYFPNSLGRVVTEKDEFLFGQ